MHATITHRQFPLAASALAATALAQTSALGVELVRLATLTPSRHSSQCWQFRVEDKVITILPDLLRRCPAVVLVDHHVIVSLGCAAENMAHAALANGQHAEARF
jgi:hypothetical protein